MGGESETARVEGSIVIKEVIANSKRGFSSDLLVCASVAVFVRPEKLLILRPWQISVIVF